MLIMARKNESSKGINKANMCFLMCLTAPFLFTPISCAMEDSDVTDSNLAQEAVSDQEAIAVAPSVVSEENKNEQVCTYCGQHHLIDQYHIKCPECGEYHILLPHINEAFEYMPCLIC